MVLPMKVKMIPHLDDLAGESGINRVVEAYFKHLPDFGIELVKDGSHDLRAVHAGASGGDCDVAHLHGMYFTADYQASDWEWRVNARIVEAIRHAKEITVPSDWVAETFERDIRKSPHIVPHGIDWREWQHTEENQGYVLWNKNRRFDVCDNSILDPLIKTFSDVTFVSTLVTPQIDKINRPSWPSNFKILEDGGKTPHHKMKRIIQRAGIYLSTTKETFGIGALEAMASGVPVLGWRYGGNVQLIEHGVNGYLAEPNNFQDLAEGLNYCLKYRDKLGANGIELSKRWTWERACQQIVDIYNLALNPEPDIVDIIIPVYNKPPEQLLRAIESTKSQTLQPANIIVVDDGSNESCENKVPDYVTYIRQHNQGVAQARNTGIRHSSATYICCLDADDWLEPSFLEICVKELKHDRSLGIAYTGLKAHQPDKEPVISDWPPPFNYDRQIRRQNQVPTACVFRRDAWERVGGYRSRYCPMGAGSEDAAFWTAIGSIGYHGKKVTDKALFNYSLGTGMASGNAEYREVDWLAMYPWVEDKKHPLASIATPKFLSHPVRQYDEPLVSVIIPVGPGHEREVINALDSLEMQHFRKWEAVIVWDNDNSYQELLTSFPYARLIESNKQGAGYARNRGAEIARGDFLFFLDADDMLADPNAFNLIIEAWNDNEAIIYSDYLGKAVWDYGEAQKKLGDKLLQFNSKTSEAVFKKHSVEYDCERAQQQPKHENISSMPYYHWALISVLIPKAWHNEIGGFDESLETWEDVDYHWRLARAGKCYYRVKKHLVLYNYHKGHRREASGVHDQKSLQRHKNLVQYIRDKYKDIKPMGCDCGGKRNPPKQTIEGQAVNMDDNEFVLIEFDFPGSDTRASYGKSLKSPTRQIDSKGQLLNYHGYSRRKGDRFLVHVADHKARPDMFKLAPQEVKRPEIKKEPTPEPELIKEPEPESDFDFSQIDGVSPRSVNALEGMTKSEALQLGVEGLAGIKWVGKKTAKKIIEHLIK